MQPQPVSMSALSDSVASAQLESPPARRALTAVPDRAAREAAAAIARLAYCEQLKEVRLQRGVTLTEIAERSKVNQGLYVGTRAGRCLTVANRHLSALVLPGVRGRARTAGRCGLERVPAAVPRRRRPADLAGAFGAGRTAAPDAGRSRVAAHVARAGDRCDRRSRHGRRNHRGSRMVDAGRGRHRRGRRHRDLLLSGYRLSGLHTRHVVAPYQRQSQTRQGTPPGALTTRTNTSWL